MHILFLSAMPLHPAGLGGAEVNAHLLMSALQPYGPVFEAHGAYSPETLDSICRHLDRIGIQGQLVEGMGAAPSLGYDFGYPVRLHHAADMPEAARSALEGRAWDAVFIQARGWPELCALSRAAGRFTVLFIHDLLSPEEFAPPALDRVDLLVANSEFTRRVLENTFRHPAALCYPLIPQPARPAPSPPADRPFITFVNPLGIKGRDLFFAMARELLDLEFLVVMNWGVSDLTRQVLERYPNVTLMPRQEDMDRVWERTRLLLVPSICEEAFGRVAPEAQGHGIPVLASRVGGLPEAVGRGGLLIDEFRNPEAWVRAIAAVLTDPDLYARLSERARIHAGRFEPGRAAAGFWDDLLAGLNRMAVNGLT
ncbi:MAG: glycosyltransferase [Proteobacteria bacterium]|nr:glycosyltransferase [Pseudomonadota bacterium]